MGLRYPASIDWEVTSFCNHNCIHCYNCWRSQDDKSKDILFNRDVTKAWYTNIAKIIVRNRPVSVVITGGEPLSVFWKIDEAIEYLISSGVYVSINSNLTLIDTAIARRLKELDVHIFTSVPSANPKKCDMITGVHGSFTSIDRGIRMCIEHKIPIATNMVLTRINASDTWETANYIKSLGMNYFCCTKAAFPANARNELRQNILSYDEFNSILSDIIKIGSSLNMNVDSAWAYSLCGLEGNQISQFGFKRRCGAGRFNFAITCTGDIKACNVDTHVYGNILSCEFSDAIQRMSKWQTNAYLPIECQDCKSLYLCGGGCRLEAENTFGDKCHLDSTANIENKNRVIDPPPILSINPAQLYKLKDGITIVEEAECCRLSWRNLYEFITDECRNFFDEYLQFSLIDFQKALDLDDDLAKVEFSEFVDKGFFIEL